MSNLLIRWLLFLGVSCPPGIGKTHVSIALGANAVEKGYTVCFERITNLIKLLKTAEIQKTSEHRIKRIMKSDLIIIDEIGYTPIEKREANLFFSLISETYEKWIRDHRNILLTGPTGIGKSYIASALANKACREGLSAFYIRVPRLFQELTLSHADGSYFKLLGKLGKVDLLIIDDWGFSKLKENERKDLLEVIEMRSLQGSTLIASQLPPEKWYEYFDDPTFADAVLDRIVHNAYKIMLKGESMRKRRSNLT